MRALLYCLILVFSFGCTGSRLSSGPAEVRNITPTEYTALHGKDKKAMLVDVRTPAEFEAGHLEQAQNTNFLDGTFEQEIKNWDKNKTYYLYCASGNRSGKAAKLMQEAGFKKIYNLGGFKDLKAAGLPVKE